MYKVLAYIKERNGNPIVILPENGNTKCQILVLSVILLLCDMGILLLVYPNWKELSKFATISRDINSLWFVGMDDPGT